MKRILLTGATGLIGRHCIPALLDRGFAIHAVSSHQNTLGDLKVHWHQGSLLDPKQIEGILSSVEPSHLLHLAWYTNPKDYRNSAENLRWIRASLNLIKAFEKNNGKRLVIAGTCAEYDWRFGYCSEAVTPLAPVNLYSICKHSLQLIMTSFSEQADLSAAWGRVFNLFGPHEHPDRLIPYVIRSLLHEKEALCPSGDQLRDYLYVQDVADAFAALLDSDVAGPVNIGSGNPVILRNLILKIGEIQNKQDLIGIGSLPPREGEPPMLVADVSRLRDEVKWEPNFDLDEGLSKTVDWWSQFISQSKERP